MRRLAAAALLMLVLAGCVGQERPEGVVERWLLALNQGSAGEPGRYAAARISNAVLAGWEDLDPGELDVIEVGRATVGCGVSGWFVPFRIVRVDDSELESIACVDAGSVVELWGPDLGEIPVEVERLPSEGGPPIAATPATAWLVALVVGVAIALVGEALMRLVRVREPG